MNVLKQENALLKKQIRRLNEQKQTVFGVIADESHSLVQKMASTVAQLQDLTGNIQELKSAGLDKLNNINKRTDRINATANSLQRDGAAFTEFVKTIDMATEYTEDFINSMIE